MKKLRLIIADNDPNYVQNLVRYILVNYAHAFELQSFTAPVYLAEYLAGRPAKSGEEADIMLLGKDCLIESATAGNSSVKAFLSEEMDVPADICMQHIYKYQHAEKLIAQIISLYAGKDGNVFMPRGRAASEVIAVFSSAGGSGKTSIAACSSAICAKRGAKVLYANIEAVCSTPAFFECGSGQTISDLIYYLKRSGSSLAAKIEGARCFDAGTGVYFFRPPDSVQDMEELLYRDMELLLDTIKRTSEYDIIFVDMSCGLSERNRAVLRICDRLMYIRVPRTDSAAKENAYKSDQAFMNDLMGKGASDHS